MEINSLVVKVLYRLVENVPDQPRRILFKGVSNFSSVFTEYIQQQGCDWDVRVTKIGEDVVGARNDATIATLIVFYKDEVRERESLNAFKPYDEDAIAAAIIQSVAIPGFLEDTYQADEVQRLSILLSLAYPSIEQLAAFLLAGKAHVGEALPYLGLFSDPGINYSWNLRAWQARLQDNHLMSVIRWRDIVERGRRSQDARRVLGVERTELLRQAETSPNVKERVLREVTLSEAQHILNPPTRLAEALMRSGMRREDAEALESNLKRGKTKPDALPPDLPQFQEDVLRMMWNVYRPLSGIGDEPPVEETRRVNSCLEGLLHMTQRPVPFPRSVRIQRSDRNPVAWINLQLASDQKWVVGGFSESSLSETLRKLSTPEPGSSDLPFEAYDTNRPEQILGSFLIINLTGRLEPYAEIWMDEAEWDRISKIDPQHITTWLNLKNAVAELRNLVDPDWQNEPTDENAEPAGDEREPNNQIYLIFDLLYLAYRQQLENYLDAWIDAAALRWRASNLAAHEREWLEALDSLLQIGLAKRYERSDDSRVVLPFYPLRLAWHRAVIQQIEGWLSNAVSSARGLAFEPGILADQLQAVDRPRALVKAGKRWLEAYNSPFFGIFVLESRHQRSRAPLERARQKIEQFGRMWPFSLDRLHVAFQPDDTGDDVYRLLIQQSVVEPESAFSVRAIVDGPGTQTAFDRYLLNVSDDTTDLLTQTHHESLLPRVDYAKGQLEAPDAGNDEITAHTALLVDAFREEDWGYNVEIGSLTHAKHWLRFYELMKRWNTEDRETAKKVHLSAPPYHAGAIKDNRRSLVYVPMNGDQPEYLRLMVDSLSATLKAGSFQDGAYYERVHWDTQSLTRLHDCADWVILFDRSLEKSLFAQLTSSKVRLIDFYPNLRGGYRLSVSSRRTEAVAWQLVQVLAQYFPHGEIDLAKIAQEMIDTLAQFASGLLLKTLGGGSLAQELLGLYATYRAMITDGVFNSNQDWLIPLDDYQGWFGRNSMKGRRADLLVLRNPAPERLELLAVESKWYKNLVNTSFVHDEFGSQGQMRITLASLRALFDPQQQRLDRSYWQRTLASLLETAPSVWDPFKNSFSSGEWTLRLDGLVYVHQYTHHDLSGLSTHETNLNQQITQLFQDKAMESLFNRAIEFKRLRLKSYPDLLRLVG